MLKKWVGFGLVVVSLGCSQRRITITDPIQCALQPDGKTTICYKCVVDEEGTKTCTEPVGSIVAPD